MIRGEVNPLPAFVCGSHPWTWIREHPGCAGRSCHPTGDRFYTQLREHGRGGVDSMRLLTFLVEREVGRRGDDGKR